MQILRFLILGLLIPSVCYGWGVPVMIGGGPAASGGGCTPSVTAYASQISGSSSTNVAHDADHYYVGYLVNSGQSTETVCSFDIEVNGVTGDISSYTYYLEHWTRSGTALDTKQNTSQGISGGDLSAGVETFQFDSSFSLAAGDVLVLTRGGYDASNYLQLDWNASSDSYMAYVRYNSSGTQVIQNTGICLNYSSYAPQ